MKGPQIKNNKNPRFAFVKQQQQQHCLLILISIFINVSAAATATAFDYADALSKSLLYFEAQRSGRLPYNQRVTWRDHSGLTDGLEQGVGLIVIAMFSFCLLWDMTWLVIFKCIYVFLIGWFGRRVLWCWWPCEIWPANGFHSDYAFMGCHRISWTDRCCRWTRACFRGNQMGRWLLH